MLLKSLGVKREKLSAGERILIALWLDRKEQSISQVRNWLSPSYRGKNVYSVLSRLARDELIASGRRPGAYRLTVPGAASLSTRFPLLSVPERGWEGEFGTVVFDAHRRGRNHRALSGARPGVVSLLRLWRFGRLARGVYISVHRPALSAAVELIREERLGDELVIGAFRPSGDPAVIAERAWGLSIRGRDWRFLVDRILEARRSGRSGRQIRNDLLAMLLTEPMLPGELLPPDYAMSEAMGRLEE